jgi:hypothetical protein
MEEDLGKLRLNNGLLIRLSRLGHHWYDGPHGQEKYARSQN